MIYPEILYDNVIRGITPTWSGTTVSEYPPANCYDWRNFSLFEADTGNLDFVMTADTPISELSVYVRTLIGGSSNTIELQYESAPAVFTSLQTVNPVQGKLSYDKFTEVTVATGRKIRFVVTVGGGDTIFIRQLVVGVAMVAEQGQYQSAQDPTLVNGVKVSNTISVNGSIIGRSIKRLDRKGNLQLDNLSAAWVRSDWEPFANHAARYPFIYQWNDRDYPDSTAFSTATLETPQHSGIGDLMNVSGKLQNLVADDYAV